MNLALRQEFTDRVNALRFDWPESVQLGVENDYVRNPSCYTDETLQKMSMVILLLQHNENLHPSDMLKHVLKVAKRNQA